MDPSRLVFNISDREYLKNVAVKYIDKKIKVEVRMKIGGIYSITMT